MGIPEPGASRMPGAGEIHLWRITLDAPDALPSSARNLLSPDETARADRFLRDEHRRRFTVTRGALRILLGRYLSMSPAAVAFAYGDKGKPRFADTDACLEFNVSHSNELALVAFANGRALGVDVEWTRTRAAGESIARRFFSPAETTALMALPEADREWAFYACWTRKEAYIKARGEGVSLGLDTFGVTLAPGTPPKLLFAKEGEAEVRRWTFEDIDPGPGYAGALAYEGTPASIQCFDFDPQA